MHSSMDYRCACPMYEDYSDPMANERYFSSRTWPSTPSRSYTNEGHRKRTTASKNRSYFQKSHSPRSRQVRRRDLFPSFYNCYSHEEEYGSPITSFRDFRGVPGSRNSNSVIHQDAAPQVYDRSNQTAAVERDFDFCSPAFWAREELMNSHSSDNNKSSYPTNQYANNIENSFSHSYSSSQDFSFSYVEPQLSKRLPIHSANADYRNNLPSRNPISSTKLQTNPCTQSNSEVTSLDKNTRKDTLSLIIKDTIWTSRTENYELANEESEYLRKKKISDSACDKMTTAKSNNAVPQTLYAQQDIDDTRTKNENSNRNSFAVLVEKQETNIISDFTLSDIEDPEKCSKIFDDIISGKTISITNDVVLNQTGDLNTYKSQLTKELNEIALAIDTNEPLFPELSLSAVEKTSEYSSVEFKQLNNISGKHNKFSTTNDEVLNHTGDDLNTYESQLENELIEIALAIDVVEPLFPELSLSMHEKTSEYSSVEFTQLQNISGKHNKFSTNDQSQLTNELIEQAFEIEQSLFPEHILLAGEKTSECSNIKLNEIQQDLLSVANNFETQENKQNKLGTLHNFSANSTFNKILRKDVNDLPNMLESNAKSNNDLYTKNSDSFHEKKTSNLPSGSKTNHCLDEPFKIPLIPSIYYDNYDDWLSTCVAPNSVLNQKKNVKARRTKANTAKTKNVFQRKGRKNPSSCATKSTDSARNEIEVENSSGDFETNSLGWHTDFKIYNDATTQVTEIDSTKVWRRVDKQDMTTQWEYNLVDAKTQWEYNLVDAETQYTELDGRKASKQVDKQETASQWEENIVDGPANEYFANAEEKKDGSEHIPSHYQLNETMHKDDTTYEEPISLQCSEFYSKKNAVIVEEKCSMKNNALTKANPLDDFTTPVTLTLKREKIDGELITDSTLESIHHNSNLTQSDDVTKASVICQKSQFLEGKHGTYVCDAAQMNSINTKIVLNVPKSDLCLKSKEHNITKTSSLLMSKNPGHYETRLSKKQGIHFQYDSEESLDASVSKIDCTDSGPRRKHSATPLSTSALKSNSPKKKRKPNLFEAIRKNITCIWNPHTFDPSRSVEKFNEINPSDNCIAIKQKSKQSKELSIKFEQNNGKKKDPELEIKKVSPQGPRVLRKRKISNSNNPPAKQLKEDKFIEP